MPIQELEKKVKTIAEILSDDQTVKSFTDRFGDGPTLYFYRKLLNARQHATDIRTFLNDRSNLELCYSVLGLWGMNTRRARLQDFEAFCNAIDKASDHLIALESAFAQGNGARRKALDEAYEAIDVMETTLQADRKREARSLLFP